jgi:hypothetical protein
VPERGWAILTVRRVTAEKVKELARSKGLTVGELLSELMGSGGGGWVTCSLWGLELSPRTYTNTWLGYTPCAQAALISQSPVGARPT